MGMNFFCCRDGTFSMCGWFQLFIARLAFRFFIQQCYARHEVCNMLQ